MEEQQQKTSYGTGSRVEVSSEEEGFIGAWYTARVLAAPRGSISRKNQNFLVKYENRFVDENGVRFLMDIVPPDFVRPLPPPSPPGEEQLSRDFQLYDVVDAYLREGWWRGVITGVIHAAGSGSGSGSGGVKYLVSFENPPEEIEFRRSELRFHLQWVDSKWVRPPKQIPEMATVTTVSGNTEAAMTPGYVVYKRLKRRKDDLSRNPTISDTLSEVINSTKRSKLKTNETVDCNSSRREETGVSQQSLVRRQKVDGVDKGDAGAMNETVVRDYATKENELDRLSGKGVSHQPHFIFDEEESLKLMADSGYCPSAANSHTIEEAPRSGSSQIAQLDPGKRADEIPIGMCSDTFDEQPTVIENSGVSYPCLKASTPAAVVCGDSASKCQKLSFVKRSPVWNSVESLEVFKKMPQKPHFAPLVVFKEDSREGFAIGHMVTFANVMEKMSKLEYSSDVESLMKRSLEALFDLKNYGFEVEAVQVRLKRLLSMKDDISHLESEWQIFDSEIIKHSLEISELEKEMNGLEVELRKLQERLATLAPSKKAKGETVANLRLKVDGICHRIKTTKLEFDQLAASPL